MKNLLKYASFTVISLLLFSRWSISTPNPTPEPQEQDKIVEEVKINWWQVPVFAVDFHGNSIIDLKPEDVEVWVDGKQIETFQFYKLDFMVSEKQETTGTGKKGPGQTPVPVQGKTVFLIFDVVLSGASSIHQAKDIAEKLISEAGVQSRFVIMSIEPFKGLTYISGPTSNPQELIAGLKYIKEINNKRKVDTEDILVQMELRNPRTGTVGQKYEAKEMKGFKEFASLYHKRKILGFFEAIKNLYIVLNSFEDNKFAYLFSEGISHSQIKSMYGGDSFYQYQLKNAAKSLGQSSTVLFIINPKGVVDHDTLTTTRNREEIEGVKEIDSFDENPTSQSLNEKLLSGEDSLRFLAGESGGRYLEGAEEEIVKSLTDLHRAYYEISFQDIPSRDHSKTRDIRIKSKRNNITLHSLRTLEKPKRYTEMTAIEQEIVVLNLISYNPLMRNNLAFDSVRVTGVEEEKEQTTFQVSLPEEFLYHDLDLYKCRLRGSQELVGMERERIIPEKPSLRIAIPTLLKPNEPSTSPLAADEPIKPYFVLINRSANRALIRGIGDEMWIEAETEPQKTAAASHAAQETPQNQEALNRLLQGTANYCDKLRNSAFHFICTEEIQELRIPLATDDRMEEFYERLNISHLIPRDLEKLRNEVLPEKKDYLFTYRLLKQGENILEERDWLSENKEGIHQNNVIRPTAFLSQKAVFAPLTLLARERQECYQYRFIRYDYLEGRPVAIISALPRNPGSTNVVYGTLWVDNQDFSIMKIEADPHSIVGYEKLADLARQLKTHLDLSLETDFNKTYNGLRFPTRVCMIENYRGGRTVSSLRGPLGWERNRTVFTYSDYQFFNVQMDVTVEKE